MNNGYLYVNDTLGLGVEIDENLLLNIHCLKFK